MSSVYSDGTPQSYFEGKGYRVYTGVITNEECEQTFNSVTLEICFFIFGSEAKDLITRFGMDVTKLIADPDLRKKIGISDGNIRRNGNPRDSKVLKKSGKTQLYVSRAIRDKIRRNKRIFDIMASMHSSRTLAFASGLEHVIYKPFKTEESLPILDCKIFKDFGSSDSLENPFHYTCLVCVSTATPFQSSSAGSSGSEDSTESSSKDGSEESSGDDDASIWLLEGFDVHYDEILKIIKPTGIYPISKQKKNIDVSLLENLNLRGINEELRKIHESKVSADFMNQLGHGNHRKRSFTGASISPFVPLQWKRVAMKPGDVLVFDCRIPYMTSRNQKSMPVMYVPVSLRPISRSWYNTVKHKELMAGVTEGKSGNWARRIAKSCNIEEFTWRTHQKDLPGSNIKSITDLSDFDQQDSLIFGLSRYALL